MEALTAADILDVWERGAPLGPLGRALTLLGRARPDLPDPALLTVTIGRRDSELLELRRATFGNQMTAVVDCPNCGVPLEFEFDVSDVITDAPEVPPDLPQRVQIGDREATVRVPTTADIAMAIAAAGTDVPEPGATRRSLLGQLVVDESRDPDGDATALAGATDDLPDELQTAIADAILLADPGVDIRLSVACPNCGRTWEAMLDVPTYLWTEVEASARRLALDVSQLAAAYGWREGDVLELTPWRRQLYLDLAAG